MCVCVREREREGERDMGRGAVVQMDKVAVGFRYRYLVRGAVVLMGKFAQFDCHQFHLLCRYRSKAPCSLGLVNSYQSCKCTRTVQRISIVNVGH